MFVDDVMDVLLESPVGRTGATAEAVVELAVFVVVAVDVLDARQRFEVPHTRSVEQQPPPSDEAQEW